MPRWTPCCALPGTGCGASAIAGRPIFGHYARQVIANLEALERNPVASSDGASA